MDEHYVEHDADTTKDQSGGRYLGAGFAPPPDLHTSYGTRDQGDDTADTDYRRPYHTYRDAYNATRGLFFFSISWGFE